MGTGGCSCNTSAGLNQVVPFTPWKKSSPVAIFFPANVLNSFPQMPSSSVKFLKLPLGFDLPGKLKQLNPMFVLIHK